MLLEASLRDLPLNAELDAESTGRKLAERAWDDPERDEYSDKEHEDAGKQDKIRSGRNLFAAIHT